MKNFFVIFNAVVLANICTLVLYETFKSYRAGLALQNPPMQFEQVVTPAPASIEAVEPQPVQQSQAVEKKQSEALRKTRRLCDYWAAQYRKEPTDYHKALREKACLKYEQLKPATSSAE